MDIYCKRCGGTLYYSGMTCVHIPIYGDGTLKERDKVSLKELKPRFQKALREHRPYKLA